jgi:hypothetical protein
MKRLIGGVAFAAAVAVLGLGAGPASADDETKCVWPEDGDEYDVGVVKEEFWGTETRPDGSVAHRFRLFRCEEGRWWNYLGDRYYPAGGGGGGGGGGGNDGWGCSTDPWDHWGWDWPDPLCMVGI